MGQSFPSDFREGAEDIADGFTTGGGEVFVFRAQEMHQALAFLFHPVKTFLAEIEPLEVPSGHLGFYDKQPALMIGVFIGDFRMFSGLVVDCQYLTGNR